MSGNQKPTSGGGPQTQQRYPGGGMYQPRSDGGYHVPPNSAYVPQGQPNQPGNQGQALRTIAPTGPPNQASTPPTNDIKVQPVPQQQMNHMYVGPQQQVRGNQTYFRTTTGAPSQPSRMPNQHRQNQQQIFPQAAQYAMQMPVPPIMFPNVQYSFNGQRPQALFPQHMPTAVYGGQPLPTASFQFTANPNQSPATIQYPFYQMQRPNHPPQTATMPPNPAQIQHTMPIPQPPTQQAPFQRQPNKRRAKTIPIIDPNTGVDLLEEVYEQQNNMYHPTTSGESSARQTPQPAQPVTNPHKEVQAIFAKQVAQAIGRVEQQPNVVDAEMYDHHIEPHQAYHQPSPPHKLDDIVTTSILKVQAKEFVSSTSNPPPPPPTAKETPIVSAICDAVEVTLPNKQPTKDRESPAKGRNKQQQQHQQTVREHGKDSAASANINKDVVIGNVDAAVAADPVAPPANDKDASVLINKGESIASNSSSNINNKANKEVAAQAHKDVAVPKDDKRVQQKRDVKFDANSKIADCGDAAVISPQSNPDGSSINAKSKNSSQRGNKDAQKQQQQQQQQPLQPPTGAPKQVAPLPAVVPPPQPSKPNNKSSKKTELNQKGANKEGTDMDAFNDNERLDAVNANVTSNVTTNDIINANSLNSNVIPIGATVAAPPTASTNAAAPPPTAANVTATNQPITTSNVPLNVNESAPRKNSNDAANMAAPPAVAIGAGPAISTSATTIRPETAKTLPKGKIDITDIVKDKPKPIKTFPTAPAPVAVGATTADNSDETDRSPLNSNDKLVQAKNEANVKASAADGGVHNINETKSDLPYREDQWAPDKQDGKKVYDRDFLLALRNKPESRKKPDNLPDNVIPDERGRLSDGRFSMGGGRTDFTNPPFPNNYGGKSSSRSGGTNSKRGSLQGKVNCGGNRNNKSQVIKLSISVKEDVKLHEAENAWKPARFNKGDVMSDEDHKTEELYRKVRGVLNKLTPQKFDTLLSQVRDLKIDTPERLQGVIDLVFEKAVDEPNFSVAYALMCRELALMQVPVGGNTTEDKKEYVNFRKLLVTRCQIEFEKQSLDESVRNDKVKEIAETVDPDRKKELQFELDESDRKLRMKSVGNIRFIGELFKQQMLTVKIMMRCLNNLIQNKDEESLECLCKLLTTIGKELESKSLDLTKIFMEMREIAEMKHGRFNSRVKFMLQDVIDLRRNKWVPRRQDVNPKTIDQIQKEAENEHLNIQSMNSVPMTPRKDDRGSNSGQNSDRKRNRNVSDDGWTTASRNNRAQFSVQSDKLKNKVPLTDEPLGNRQMFGNWSKGSNIKTDMAVTANTANMYAALENIDTEKRPSGSRPNSKDPYSSKGSSLERSTYKQSFDGRSSRSGSQQRLTDSAPPAAAATIVIHKPSTPRSESPQLGAGAAKPAVAEAAAPVYEMDDEQLERHVKNNLDEYLNDSCTVDEYIQDTRGSVPPEYLSRVVADGYLHVIERSRTARLRTGMLFAGLLKRSALSIDQYCIGLEEVLSQADDLTIDIPKIWDYLAEILHHLICENALTLSRLHKSCELVISQGHGAKLMAALFKLVISEKGPNFLKSCWENSGLSLGDFMPQDQVDNFITDNKLEFLCGGDTPAGQAQLTQEQIHKKLLEFLNARTCFDDIVNWITANVGDRVKENQFIRTLATAIFENSIEKSNKLVPKTMQTHYTLLLKYVDNNSNYELQCLYALQALIQKLEHPQGLLLSICENLYEDSVFSQDSFIAWESSTDPAEHEGKGVALKQLTSFFTHMKENDEDEDYGSSDEDA